MKLITWNVDGRTLRLRDQIAALLRQEPDIVCLQEVRPSTRPIWEEALSRTGMAGVVDSPGRSARGLFNLTATAWSSRALPPIELPQPERLLSVVTDSPHGPIEIHNLHVPPVRDREGTRAETLTRVHDALATKARCHRILCGDLNTARAEHRDPDLDSLGELARAENLLLRGLAPWDLRDVFRGLHGYERGAVTRSGPGFHRVTGHRLDHILASGGLGAIHCEYQDGWRQEGLSDHSAMEAIFAPVSVA